MANRAKDIRLFQRASDQRLATAQFLLENGFHLDAIYLTGYAVECMLKALILKRTPANQYRAMFARITSGKQAHDFEFLTGILKHSPLNCVLTFCERWRRGAPTFGTKWDSWNTMKPGN